MLPQQELNEKLGLFSHAFAGGSRCVSGSNGALVRKRRIRDAEALLRILLGYGFTELSLQSLAAWGKDGGLSDCTKEAFVFQVRDCESWLSELLTFMLASEAKPVDSGLRLRVVNATVLCGAGATGIDWRVYVLSDPGTGRV